MNINIFLDLATIFAQNNYQLYMVGGTSRDYLLNREEVLDYDFATDATPEEIQAFLPEVNMTFAFFGTVRYRVDNANVDIATFREEGTYSDSRHPEWIRFIRNIKKDYVRRDFTINAIYIDAQLQVHDFCKGIEDLKYKVIKTIGDPFVRIKEDPLRIIRALRFKLRLAFTIDKELENAILSCVDDLDKLTETKILAEIRKITDVSPKEIYEEFAKYGLEKFIM